MIVATAGHVDHGKTALIKALTGVETDRLPEEKARGVSIELGFAYMPLEGDDIVGFIDVPGHERFIRNMLAGVAGIDAALLVVAADDGVMPQTREHLAILDLLSVPKGVVALTKSDLVDNDKTELVQASVQELLRGTSLEGAPIIRTIAPSGEGIGALKSEIVRLHQMVPARAGKGGFRLAIDRNFSIPGVGRVITGTVFAGAAKIGDRIVLSDSGEACRIRGIHVQDRESVVTKAGDRTALNIVGVTGRIGEISRGCWAVAPHLNVPSNRFDVTIKVLESESRPLRHRTPVHIHMAAKHAHGRVAVLEGRSIEPGESAKVQIVTDEPVLGHFGDYMILRNQSSSRTVAGGRIVDPFSPPRGRSRPERLALVAAMDNPDPAAALVAMLDLSDFGLDLNQFVLARNLDADEAGSIFNATEMDRIQSSSQNLGLQKARFQALKDAIIATLSSWHAREPHHLGPDQRNLLRAHGRRVSQPFHEHAVDQLIDEGDIVRSAGRLHLASHRPEPTSADQNLWQRVEGLLREKPGGPALAQPPVLHALAEELKITAEETGAFMSRAAELGWVVGVARNRYLLPEAVIRLAQVAVALASGSQHAQFTARDFRDASGIGRNLVIQLLEFFDRQGLTRRSGDFRQIIGNADEIF